MRGWLWLLGLAACGRVGFDEHGLTADAGADAGPDAGDGLVVHYPMDIDPLVQIEAAPARYALPCPAPCPARALPGRIGAGAYRFELTGDPLVLPVALGTAPFTVSLWVNADNFVGIVTPLAQPRDATSSANLIALTVINGFLRYESALGKQNDAFPAQEIADVRGAWFHVAVTWDGTLKRLFVDGVLIGSADGGFDPSDQQLCIGGDVDGGSFIRYAGSLDDLRIYSRALTEGEIAALAE